jgi:hypothetical protein
VPRRTLRASLKKHERAHGTWRGLVATQEMHEDWDAQRH